MAKKVLSQAERRRREEQSKAFKSINTKKSRAKGGQVVIGKRASLVDKDPSPAGRFKIPENIGGAKKVNQVEKSTPTPSKEVKTPDEHLLYKVGAFLTLLLVVLAFLL